VKGQKHIIQEPQISTGAKKIMPAKDKIQDGHQVSTQVSQELLYNYFSIL
jgi:hypothetical protein